MHLYSVVTPETDLTGSTARTLIQLVTPSTRRAKIKEFSLSFRSVTSTDEPVVVELLEESTAGTSSAATPEQIDRADPAALCTAAHTFTSTDPTAGDVLRRFRLTPIGGLIVYQFPEGMEPTIAVSTRVGLRVTPPQTQNDVIAELIWQE